MENFQSTKVWYKETELASNINLLNFLIETFPYRFIAPPGFLNEPKVDKEGYQHS